MALVHGTILASSGAALSTPIRFQRLDAATLNASGAVISGGVIMSTAAALASPGVTLGPGGWLVNWSDGPAVSRIIITVPDDSETHTLQDLATATPATTGRNVFASEAEVAVAAISRGIDFIIVRSDANQMGWVFVRITGPVSGNPANVLVDAAGGYWQRL